MGGFLWRMADLSISGSIAIMGVFVFRWILRNQNKIFSYILWIIVGIRLLISVSFNGIWGWLSFPFLAENDKNTDMIFYTWSHAWETGKEAGHIAETSGKALGQSFTMEHIIKYLFLFWITGVILLMAKNMAAYFRLKRKVAPCIRERDYYISDNISGAFVLGVITPKIYLCSHLTQEERRYMLAHERIHLKRRDYLWKWVAECICCIHWFNPFVWIAFRAFTADMEMSCDEAVLRMWNQDERAEYARVFLAEAVESGEGNIVPFFRKGGTERRIRNMMKSKKITKRTMGICAGVVAAAALLLLPSFWEKDSLASGSEKSIAVDKGVCASAEDNATMVPVTGREYGYPTSQYSYETQETSNDVTENIEKVADDIRNTLGGKEIMICYDKAKSEKLARKHGYHAAYTMVFTADLKILKDSKNKYGLSGHYKDMQWYLVKDDRGNWKIDDADIYHVKK